VCDWLRGKNLLEKAGGEAYLFTLAELNEISAHHPYYCDIVKELAQRRRVIERCQWTIARAMDKTEELPAFITDLKAELHKIETDKTPEYADNVSLLQAIVDRASSKTPPKGVETGFDVLDENLGTLEPGTTCYLAARSSTGKTALGLAIIDNVLKAYSGTPILFSLEMGADAILRRRLSAMSQTALTRLKYGNVDHTQWPDVMDAAKYLAMPQPYIFDASQFSKVEIMLNYAGAIARDKEINLIVIDHIQRITSQGKTQSRHLELSYVSRCIADMAKDLKLPVIVLCQLRRGQDDNARPKLSDLKECVTGGTAIYTNKGIRSIKHLHKYRHCDFKVRSYDVKSGKIKYIRPEKVVHTGKKRCLRIRLKSGKIIVVSENTKFWSDKKWVKADELKVGSKILSDSSIKKTRKGVTFNTGATHIRKGEVPWNRGLKEEDDKRVAAYVKSNRGKKRQGAIMSPEWREKNKKARPPIGTKKNNRGYILIYKPEWASSSNASSSWNGYVFEHRYIMEKHIGRMLKRHEIIHHIDGDKENNKIENLLLCKNAKEHEELHQREQRFVERMIAKGRIFFDGKDFQLTE